MSRPGGNQVIPRPAAWRPGRPAPWRNVHQGDPIATAALRAAVAARGGGRAPRVEFVGARHSAVLVALFDGPLGAEVVLTRRSQQLRNHKGEVSFPGGRQDPGETAIDTALREAEEEVGLEQSLVEVIGELDHLATVVSRSLIVPVVGLLPGRPDLRPATGEVDRVFTVPLVELLRDDTYREERWGEPPLDRPVYFFDLDDETVWGATARMLVQLLAIVTGADDPGAGW